MTSNDELLDALMGPGTAEKVRKEAKRQELKKFGEKLLVLLIAWPLDAWFLTLSAEWLRVFWPQVPVVPFWGAMAVVFAAGTVRKIVRGTR